MPSPNVNVREYLQYLKIKKHNKNRKITLKLINKIVRLQKAKRGRLIKNEMSNFVDDFHAWTIQMESPDSYWRWSAYAGIAATMRDNYYWEDDGGNRRIYPNIYVVLYAKSAATKKGAPLNKIKPLIQAVDNTKFFGGRFSIQTALKRLSEVHFNEKKQQIKGASCLMYTEELASMLVDDKSVVNLLTDLYDYHSRWTNDILKNDGAQVLENVCISLLAASNDQLFKELFNKAALYGGLLGRCFLIVETHKRCVNSGMFCTPVDPTLKPKMIEHLKKIAAHTGRIVFSDEAKEEYDNWYTSLGDLDNDPSGILNRMPTSALKLSMILAASEYDFNMVVEKRHIERAIDETVAILKNYKLVVPTLQNTKTESLPMDILHVIMNAKDYQIGMKPLMRRLTGVVANFEVFKKALDWLVDNGSLIPFQLNGEIAYRASQDLIDKVNDKVGRKKK